MSTKIHFRYLIRVQTEEEALNLMEEEFDKVKHKRCASVTGYFWIEEINDGWKIKTTHCENIFEPIEIIQN